MCIQIKRRDAINQCIIDKTEHLGIGAQPCVPGPSEASTSYGEEAGERTVRSLP